MARNVANELTDLELLNHMLAPKVHRKAVRAAALGTLGWLTAAHNKAHANGSTNHSHPPKTRRRKAS